MLARLRKSQEDEGFTLIELLVVMIIIGILAAIAIPVFLSQRAKAQDTAVKADVSTLGKEIATYFVDNTAVPTITITSGRYVVAGNDAGRASNGVTGDSALGNAAAVPVTTIPTTGWTSSAWCATLYNPNGSQKTFKYSAQNGLEAGQCTSITAP
jgi:type IV pilus assembly protein PilA